MIHHPGKTICALVALSVITTPAAETNKFPTQNFVVPDGFAVELAAGTESHPAPG
ncbi:MAG: hypothetical protein V9H26_23800 [Verrucomicrobiota bacterium]